MTNPVASFFGRIFNRPETSESIKVHRTVPAFVEKQIEDRRAQIEQQLAIAKARNSQYEAFFPMSGYWGGSYLSDGQKIQNGIVFRGSAPTIDHNMTLRNSRDAFHTSPVARAIVERKTEAIVGDGIRLEPKIRATLLGMTPEQAESKAREIKERFGLWAESRFCSLDETMNLYQRQRLSCIQSIRDGEYFIRFHYLDDGDRPNSLALSSIDPNQIVGYPYTYTADLPWTQDGIIRDERGRETAYQVRVRNSNGEYVTRTIPAYENGRRMMIHGFTPEYAGQVRGYSQLHHAIQEFSQATDFTMAQISKAIKQSSIIMANQTEPGSTPMGNLFTLAGAGPLETVVEDATATTSTEVGNVPPYVPTDVYLSPGGIGMFDVKAGNKIDFLKETAPSDTFAGFMEMFISLVAASCSIPYEVVLQRFSSNYTASRGALVQFYRHALILRGEQKSDFLMQVYEAWFAEEIAAGRIAAKGWLNPLMRLAWLSADWVGPLMPDIDPQKSVDAARDAVEANLSNIALESQKYNGSDAAMNRATNERILSGAGRAPWNSNERSDQKQQTKTIRKAMEE